MGALFLLVFFIISICIVGLVLLQEGKGGGLAGMSAGMDGVMGAKNPLRRFTAWFFAAFIVMAVVINYFFHHREDTALPTGAANVPGALRTLEETIPATGPVVLPDNMRPDPADGEGGATGDAAEVVPDPVLSEDRAELQPEVTPVDESAVEPLQPPAAEPEAATEPVQPPAADEAAVVETAQPSTTTY